MLRVASWLLALGFLLGLCRPAQARVEVEAIPGRPFGVGRITVPLSPEDASAAQLVPRLALTEADGRIHYPAIETGRFREIVGGLLGGGGDIALPGRATAYFLFTGDEPLRITFYTPTANTAVVRPEEGRRRQYDRMLNQWWRQYQNGAQQREAAGEVPPLFDAYLTTMLSQRLRLPLAGERRMDPTTLSQPEKTLDLLLGVERLRAEILRDTLLSGAASGERADLPVPRDIDWSQREPVDPPEGAHIEPIAQRVPVECFYVRFGKFSNYLWLDQLIEDYGGDLANMVTLRGQDLRLGERAQTQLCLRKNELARVVGDAVIADVALIGRDIYTHEGAAIGMLFQARNTRVLGNDLAQTRKKILEEYKDRGATVETLEIGGKSVEFLSTPDNRLRSFYVVDGDFHLVTTSRAIVERFIDTAEGRGALGRSREFHHARTLMPTDRNDTIFVYFSSAMFQSLVGPQYQVELARRLQAVTDMELLWMARLAAQGEGAPSATVDDLIAGGFLPRGFGLRADGSRPILEKGRSVDSLRGARGAFAPIPDIRFDGITRREADRLERLSQYLATEWPDMDPLMVGIRRFKLNDEGLERIVVDAHATQFDPEKYGWLTSMIGPEATSRVLPVPGDVIHLQAVLQGGPLGGGTAPYHLFLGLQDHAPLADLRPGGFLKTLQMLQTTPGYLGAFPRPGILDRLPLGIGGQPDAYGFSRFPFGLWRRTIGPWSVLSFDPRLLTHASEHLDVEDTDNPAQVRLHVKNLAETRLAAWIDALYFERARQTSVANAELLQHVAQQFQLPPEKALAVVEEILDAELVCALGGKYEPAAFPEGAVLWQSSGWPRTIGPVPKDYHSELLTWFRGLNADLTHKDNHVTLRAQLDMQRKAPERHLELPSFNLPNIFGDFGKTSKPKESKVPVPKAEELPKGREF